MKKEFNKELTEEYVKKELIGKKIKSMTLSMTFLGVKFLRKEIDGSIIPLYSEMIYESEGGLYTLYIYMPNNIVSHIGFLYPEQS